MKPSYDPTKPWSRRRREFGASAQNGAYNEGYDKTAPTGLLRGRDEERWKFPISGDFQEMAGANF